MRVNIQQKTSHTCRSLLGQPVPPCPSPGSLRCWQHPQAATLSAGNRAWQYVGLCPTRYFSSWTTKPRKARAVASTCLLPVKWLCSPSPVSTIPGIPQHIAWVRAIPNRRFDLDPSVLQRRAFVSCAIRTREWPILWIRSVYLFITFIF